MNLQKKIVLHNFFCNYFIKVSIPHIFKRKAMNQMFIAFSLLKDVTSPYVWKETL